MAGRCCCLSDCSLAMALSIVLSYPCFVLRKLCHGRFVPSHLRLQAHVISLDFVTTCLERSILGMVARITLL
jgi:hypothetical protein